MPPQLLEQHQARSRRLVPAGFLEWKGKEAEREEGRIAAETLSRTQTAGSSEGPEGRDTAVDVTLDFAFPQRMLNQVHETAVALICRVLSAHLFPQKFLIH